MLVELENISTNDMIADVLTKELPRLSIYTL